MTNQPMPRTDRGPSVDDCLALSAYWEAEAARPEANSETVLVALAEAGHWRDVADVILTLTQATPLTIPRTPKKLRGLKRLLYPRC